MKETQKKIIQSAAIRIGVGLAMILMAYFLKEEAYQKACYAFGYFFVIYQLFLESIRNLKETKHIIAVVAVVISLVGLGLGYYIPAILLMCAILAFDAFLKWNHAAKVHPYPLYIFDLDGTIADTLESMGNTCNLVLQDLGLPPQPLEAYKTFVGDAVAKLIERALLAAGDETDENGMPIHQEEALRAYLSKFATTCTQNVTAYAGMRETLQQLKDGGAKLAVFTNKRHPQAVKVVETVYGKDFFDAILGEGNGFPRKPAPDGALHLAEQFGVSPEHCVYIGDTNTDMETGLAAGMYTIGVTWGFRKRAELEAYGPAKIIDTPEALSKITLC